MDEAQARVEAFGEQLRTKISSKFQTSTFLAGFALAILTIQISILWQADKRVPFLLPLSIALMVGSIVLYVMAVIKLDELTMPKRFWEHSPNVPHHSDPRFAYLTDDDLWELKKRMVFYWFGLTVVATGVAGLSLLTMLLPLTPREFFDWLIDETFILTAVTLLLTAVYLGILHAKAKRLFNPLVRPVD